jgi:hypothetical protein
MTRRTSHPLPLPALPAVALLALALGACAERTRYAPIALNETSIGLLERVRTYYVRTGDRHAMACQTDPAYAKRFADCGDLAQRHHPQARDIVQATLLANGCRIVFVWGDPTEYAPGERVGGIAAQPDGIVRFKHPLGPHEGFIELQTESSSAGMFDEKSGKRTRPPAAKAPFANATAQVFVPGLVQAIYKRAARDRATGNLKGVIEDVLELLPPCAM